MTTTAQLQPDAGTSSGSGFRLRRRARGGLGIGRKLTLLVAFFVTVGLMALVALQFWNQRADLMRGAGRCSTSRRSSRRAWDRSSTPWPRPAPS